MIKIAKSYRAVCYDLLMIHLNYNNFQNAFQERLRSKIHAKLLKEGSTPDEPTNIEVSDYSRWV